MRIVFGSIAVLVLSGCFESDDKLARRTGADPQSPTAAIVLTPRAVLANDALVATIEFSEEVVGLTLGDLVVQGGTISSFTALSAQTYAVALVAGGGGETTVDVYVPAQACASIAGHWNAAASGQASIAYAPWASAVGRDMYGVWADLTVDGGVNGTATQRMRLISPGTFTMGDLLNRDGSPSYYEAQHLVTLSEPFWAADTECSQAMYLAVTGSNPSLIAGSLTLPVDNVRRSDAQQFASTLSMSATNLRAMLPTESQWEYMARAGTTTHFSLATVSTETINCMPVLGDAYIESGVYRGMTLPVTSLPPNPWGLYGVHGNVWEWCSDYWVPTWGAHHRLDPHMTEFNDSVVVRGGGFAADATHSRSAARLALWPSDSHSSLGFRFIIAAWPASSG